MGEIKVSVSGDPIWRKSDCESREKGKVRRVCVGLEPRAICFRLQGCKTVVRMPIGLAYEKACELEANAMKPKRVKRTFRRGALSGIHQS
jgi:hypothetical protein